MGCFDEVRKCHNLVTQSIIFSVIFKFPTLIVAKNFRAYQVSSSLLSSKFILPSLYTSFIRCSTSTIYIACKRFTTAATPLSFGSRWPENVCEINLVTRKFHSFFFSLKKKKKKKKKKKSTLR